MGVGLVMGLGLVFEGVPSAPPFLISEFGHWAFERKVLVMGIGLVMGNGLVFERGPSAPPFLITECGHWTFNG